MAGVGAVGARESCWEAGECRGSGSWRVGLTATGGFVVQMGVLGCDRVYVNGLLVQ